MTTHSFMKQCDDCGKRVSQIVEGYRSENLGVVVESGEQVCRTCLEKRKTAKERMIMTVLEKLGNQYQEAV